MFSKDHQTNGMLMSVQSARMGLGWSIEKLANESGVAVASIYLLERMGSAGPEDDGKVRDTLNRRFAERVQSAVPSKREQINNLENIVRFGPIR